MTDKMTQNPLLEIKNLKWGYPENSYLLFDNFNLTVQKKDFFILMGKSGVGKTSLARILLGEFKIPSDMIFYNGEDISQFGDISMQSYRKKIGMVFQDYKLIEDITVKENIIYPLEILQLGKSIIQSKYNHIQELLDIESISDIPVRYLSSGEKNKVCIARAMINNPEIIIADEPTANLDRENTEQVADILIDANKNSNTVLLITHDIHLLNYIKQNHNIKLFIIS